jgi:hypothetical protein
LALTTYLGNRLLDHAVGKTSYTMPTVWIALFTTAPGIGGTGTEATYTGYARKSTTGTDFSAASALASTNAVDIVFATKSGGADQTVTHWATYDASTAGNMLEFGTLTASRLVQDGDAVRFLAGDFDRTAS